MREIEHTDYTATHKDHTESIDALYEGTATLKEQAHDVKQAAAALTQVTSSSIIPGHCEKLFENVVDKHAHQQSRGVGLTN